MSKKKHKEKDQAEVIENFMKELTDVVIKYNDKIMVSSALGVIDILKYRILHSVEEEENNV